MMLLSSDPTQNFPKTFWTMEHLDQFWHYVKWFLKYNMPIFMICLAIIVVGMVTYMIVDIPADAKKEHERSQAKRDDDDLDVRYY